MQILVTFTYAVHRYSAGQICQQANLTKKYLILIKLSHFGFSAIMVKDSDVGGNDKQWNSAGESFLYL